jgi:putative transposase
MSRTDIDIRPGGLSREGAVGAAVAAVWGDVPVQRCTAHKHRNLLTHALERLHEDITTDYNDMIYAETCQQIETRRKAFIRKWRVKHRAVADSFEEAGARLFSFTRLPPEQWKSARTTNVIERLYEEFKRRIKTQTVLPAARNRSNVGLGFACLRPDQHAQSRRLENARRKAHRSAN